MKPNKANDQVLAAIFEEYQRDWVFFVEHALGHWTWSKQREIIKAVQQYPRVAVYACHGSSKTFTAAELLVTFYNLYMQSKVISSAPTFPQVEKLLWTEVGKIYRTSRFKLSGTCQTVDIKHPNSEHFAMGFSTDKPARAEGFHAPELMFIFDEAKGIHPWMWDAAEGAMTGGFCRWLAISTTDGVNPGEQFFKAVRDQRHGWKVIQIAATDSPYVTGERFRRIAIPDMARPDKFGFEYADPSAVGAQLATPQWMEERATAWGRDSVLYITKVLGEIMDEAPDTLIKLSHVLQMFRNAEDLAFKDDGLEEIGCDVARFGDDSTVIYKRKGLKVTGRAEFRKQDTVAIAEQNVAMACQDKKIRIKVDDTGVGGGVTDNLRRWGYNVVPINFNSTAAEPDKYPDVISEMWFEAAGMIPQISCPRNDRLQAELVNRKQKRLDKKGRRVIESKDDYKKRGPFPSPDDADAFLLCFYNPKIQIPNVRQL